MFWVSWFLLVFIYFLEASVVVAGGVVEVVVGQPLDVVVKLSDPGALSSCFWCHWDLLEALQEGLEAEVYFCLRGPESWSLVSLGSSVSSISINQSWTCPTFAQFSSFYLIHDAGSTVNETLLQRATMLLYSSKLSSQFYLLISILHFFAIYVGYLDCWTLYDMTVVWKASIWWTKRLPVASNSSIVGVL